MSTRMFVFASILCLALAACMTEVDLGAPPEEAEVEGTDEAELAAAPETGDRADLATAFANCNAYSGYVYQTSPAWLQGSAATDCYPQVSNDTVTATLQWAASPYGPWYNHTSSTGYGNGWSAAAIVGSPLRWRTYWRVAGYHRWWDNGWQERWTVGRWTYVP
jgi:hypothetical protein